METHVPAKVGSHPHLFVHECACNRCHHGNLFGSNSNNEEENFPPLYYYGDVAVRSSILSSIVRNGANVHTLYPIHLCICIELRIMLRREYPHLHVHGIYSPTFRGTCSTMFVCAHDYIKGLGFVIRPGPPK